MLCALHCRYPDHWMAPKSNADDVLKFTREWISTRIKIAK